MTEPVIVTRSLSKRFGPVRAVTDLDLVVPAGERFGFLGPNGSGKTTTVRMLLGLVFATSGEIEVMGERVPRHSRAALRQVGALVESPAAYGHLSARANLALLDAAGPGGRRRGRPARIGEALLTVGLDTVGRRPVRTYSLGMQARLGLAAAIVRKPRLLVLDEPTNGLDPMGIREVRELLIRLNDAGTTVFMSSHLLAEVEATCTRVGVVDRGRLVLEGALDELRGPTGRVLLHTPDAGRVAGLLDGQVVEREGDRVVLRGISVADLTARLVAGGVRVSEVGPERRTLEEVVLSVTGAGADRHSATLVEEILRDPEERPR
jgi:ABC-2 type transport system ATP-binding protein